MASITVSSNPSTTGDTLTVNFTTDATNISDILISKDGGSTYTSATSFTSSKAVFNVSSWDNGTYSNCKLKCVYTESGGGTTPTTYTITNNLTNCTTSNTLNSIKANRMYVATITPDSGYNLLTIEVTMGGTDITSSAVSGDTVTISEVTGNIVITAKAIEQSTPPETLTISNIADITQTEKTEFYIQYTTNIAVVKHEISWDGGNTFYDKTSDVTASGTTYKFKHDDKANAGTYNMAIRVTTAKGTTKTSNVFTVTLVDNSGLTFTQYKKLDNGVVTDTTDGKYYSTVDKIAVTPSGKYTLDLNPVSYVCVCFYNSSDTYLGNDSGGFIENNTPDWSVGSLSTTINIPASASYIRICGTSDNTQVTGTLTKTSSGGTGTSGLLDSDGAYVIDDFSSNTVDPNKWGYELGYVRNGETQKYTNTNAEVNDGILALRGLKASDGSWTSASIISKGHFAFMYGKIVARVRACNYNGAFGAFWTLGDSFEFGYKENGNPDTLGEWWAYCGEFDVMEFYNGKLTCGTFFNEKEESGRVWYNDYPTGDWHEFAMEWKTDGSLIFSIDGHELSRTNATDNRAFHIPHFILLNQAIGASGGTPDSNTTEITQYVDWVKYYPLSTDNLVENSSDFTLSAMDWNDSSHNCMVRPTFNDNCINKSLTWESSDSGLVWVHSGLCSTYAGANGEVTITATSHSGVSKQITLTVSNGTLREKSSGGGDSSNTEYATSCTSAYILDKMYPMPQNHEALPSGVKDTWATQSRWENQQRPTAIAHNCGQAGCPGAVPFRALGAWANVYRVKDSGFSANTGVEMRNIKVYGWYNGQWEKVQDLAVPNGNFYAESFSGDSNQYFSDSIKTTNTSKTIILREANKINNENCMYHPFSDIKNFDTKYEYVYTCIDLRKVKWDESGTDDRDSSHYCASCGGDWWLAEGLTFDSSWQHNKGVAQPKIIEITKEWRRFSMTTVPQNWANGFPK